MAGGDTSGPSERHGLVPEYQAQIMGRHSVIDGGAPEMGAAATRGKNSEAQRRDVEPNSLPEERGRGRAATGAKSSEVQSGVQLDVAVQHALLDKRDQCAELHINLDPRLRHQVTLDPRLRPHL